MKLINKINKYWNYLEKKIPPPKYVGRVSNLDFMTLKKAVDDENEKFLKNIIRRMYVNKEAYVRFS